MIFHSADSFSLSVFTFFSLLMLVVILFAFNRVKAERKYVFTFLLYLAVFNALVLTGVVREHMMPLAPLLFASVAIVSIAFALSNLGWKVAQGFSLAALIGFQGFRLPLELILHHWANIETIPETMTWTGQNWDVVTGVVSLVTIPFLNRSRKLAWIVQIIGFVLLLNVLRVAVFSLPLPFAWPLANPLQLILYFPYAIIGPLFVGTALFSHLVIFRKLRGR